MISRKDVVTDSAIAVVAEQGVRGLTHRAVDAMAELPVGSTSNVYRTRDALVTGILERIGELNSRQFDRLVENTTTGGTPLVDAAIGLCFDLLTTDRNRFYTSVMLSLDPALPAEALAAKKANMATVDSFVMQLSGIDADLARRITSSVLGMMISELMSGAPKREHVESYINELAAWMNDYAPAQ
ncbi:MULTISPECIES: TetR/AcrR family transcriptional regulator [Brevibacterium]|uniref:TetR family transcriptional regulator n=2 Tax=Brevibacterium TaxID=1696 RepID=A0ABP9TVJ7_9MICO